MKKLLVFILIMQGLIFAQEEDKFSSQSSSLILAQPISVTIGGDFIVNGSFPATKLQRLDNFITSLFLQAKQKALGGLSQVETIKQVKQEIKQIS